MKKLFLVFFVMLVALGSSLYAQDEAATTTETAGQNESSSQSNGEGGDSIDIQAFSPSFVDLRNTDDVQLDREYNLLMTNINNLKDDYLFRIVYKANKILENYTNVNYTDTNQLFYNAIYYYDIVASLIASDNNVDLGLNEVKRCFRLYNNIKPVYEVLGKTNELRQADYQLNLYAGIINLFKGSSSYYSAARNHLNKALQYELEGEKNAEKLITINTYLAGINYKLATVNQPSDINKVYYLNEMFNNLWDLTTLKNSDEAIKTAKYKLLIKKYHPILYTSSDRFRSIYQQYYDELGFVYGDTESEVLSRDVAPVYKNEDNTASTTTTEEQPAQ